jgi:hypothetical protein
MTTAVVSVRRRVVHSRHKEKVVRISVRSGLRFLVLAIRALAHHVAMTAMTSSPAADLLEMLRLPSPRPMAPAAKVALLRDLLVVIGSSAAPSLEGSNIGNPGAVKGVARSQALQSEARSVAMVRVPTKTATAVALRNWQLGLASKKPRPLKL